jgi:hypothetical protein
MPASEDLTIKPVIPSTPDVEQEKVEAEAEQNDTSAADEATDAANTADSSSASGLFKSFDQEKKSNFLKPFLITLFIILAGIASGFGLSRIQGGNTTLRSTEQLSEGGLKVGEVFGLPDESTFRDQAQGVLVKGGIDGEGSHHLVRPGGESQNVYLTSSTVDLDVFVDHKVKVWGETFAAQTAGWLMDVGRVEVLELNAQKPVEE